MNKPKVFINYAKDWLLTVSRIHDLLERAGCPRCIGVRHRRIQGGLATSVSERENQHSAGPTGACTTMPTRMFRIEAVMQFAAGPNAWFRPWCPGCSTVSFKRDFRSAETV